MTANNAIVDGDSPYLSYTFAQPFRAERLRSLLAGPDADRGLAGRDAGGHGLARGAGLGPAARLARAVRRRRAPRRRGRCWPDSTGTSRPGRRPRCSTPASSGRSPRNCTGRCSGATTWEWVASGTLAPTMSMVRRWLGNDTWELLGMPVPPGGDQGDAGERRQRVLAAVPGALAAAWAAAVQAGGPDPAQWRWGDVHQAVRVHPHGPSRFPGVPMGGDPDTIQAAGYGWRAGAPFNVDLPVRVPAGGGPRVGRLRELRHPRRRVRRPSQPAFRRPARGVGRAPPHPHGVRNPGTVSRRRPPRRRWAGAGCSSERWRR